MRDEYWEERSAAYAKERKWDLHFLKLAQVVAEMSKDPSTQTGAVIVRPDRTIASTGYNGFPRQMPDVEEHYAEREEKYSRIIHCEMNAVLSSHVPVQGCTLYTWPFISCDRCAVHMAQAGIVAAIGPWVDPESDRGQRWAEALDRTRGYFKEMNITLREIRV